MAASWVLSPFSQALSHPGVVLEVSFFGKVPNTFPGWAAVRDFWGRRVLSFFFSFHYYDLPRFEVKVGVSFLWV